MALDGYVLLIFACGCLGWFLYYAIGRTYLLLKRASVEIEHVVGMKMAKLGILKEDLESRRVNSKLIRAELKEKQLTIASLKKSRIDSVLAQKESHRARKDLLLVLEKMEYDARRLYLSTQETAASYLDEYKSKQNISSVVEEILDALATSMRTNEELHGIPESILHKQKSFLKDSKKSKDVNVGYYSNDEIIRTLYDLARCMQQFKGIIDVSNESGIKGINSSLVVTGVVMKAILMRVNLYQAELVIKYYAKMSDVLKGSSVNETLNMRLHEIVRALDNGASTVQLENEMSGGSTQFLLARTEATSSDIENMIDFERNIVQIYMESIAEESILKARIMKIEELLLRIKNPAQRLDNIMEFGTELLENDLPRIGSMLGLSLPEGFLNSNEV